MTPAGTHRRGSGAAASRPRAPVATVHTTAALRRFQEFFGRAIMEPLGPNDGVAARNQANRLAIGQLVKGTPALDGVERLQIYARSYWYRVTDSIYEDCPGLRALLGPRRFAALCSAYLTACPSRSFTLRNLCRRLPEFILACPELSAPDTDLAHAVARFEWAQTEAFDAAAHPPLSTAEVGRVTPSRLRVALQPHVTLLAAAWPVDEFVDAVKRRDVERAVASNAVDASPTARALRRVRRPRSQRTFIVVHRYKQRLFSRRETERSFAVLSALSRGEPLLRAVSAAGAVDPAKIRQWFSTWMELGWFCRRQPD